MEEIPQVSYSDVFEKFLRDYPNPVSGRAISSRHFEPIGVQTYQILLGARHNDILVAGKHYLALKKDFPNIKEVMQRFRDAEFRKSIVRQTYEYGLDEHTYQHHIRSLVTTIFGLQSRLSG